MRMFPIVGVAFFAAVAAAFGLMEIAAGRHVWAALMIAEAAVCMAGIKVQLALSIAAQGQSSPRTRRSRRLEQAVLVMWALGGGAAVAFAVAQASAGNREAVLLYAVAAAICAQGLTVQVAAQHVFDRHAS